MELWDSPVELLLNQRGTFDELMESDDDLYLAYFINRTVGEGILTGTLADLALTIWFGGYAVFGDLTFAYGVKAFELASGLKLDWENPLLEVEMQNLRETAD